MGRFYRPGIMPLFLIGNTLLAGGLAGGLAADEEGSALELISTVAERLPYAESGQKVSSLTLELSQHTRLDTVLRQLPGISLFRRADSYSAHPTTQGLSMRGVGANAAGRVLVTLDGVPQNDPFGGWIYWSALSPMDIGSADVRSGGSPGAFGSQALSGVVEMKSRKPVRTGGQLNAHYGSYNTVDLGGTYSSVFEKGFITLSAGLEDTDGFYLISPDQRGSIDAQAASEVAHATLRASLDLGEATIEPMFRWYDEKRINGLEAATNSTEAFDASLKVSGGDDVRYEVISFYRTRDFENVFAAAIQDRTVGKPVLDQFDVPGEGVGLLARLKWSGFELGVDGRKQSGMVNERYRNLDAGFTRIRRAGGDQWTIGLFGEAAKAFEGGQVSASARLDRYKNYNGLREETDIATGDILRADTIENTSGWVPTGRLGLSYDLSGDTVFTAAAYRSWRLPTLNEYYRPFRVVNDITEANPGLTPEKLTGIEAGIRKDISNGIYLYAGLYRAWLKDGVGNVTIGFGPGFFDLGGFVPDGGVLRQRANIDKSKTDGIELEGAVALSSSINLTVKYQFARARITAFEDNPDLVGKRPVQTPRHNIRAMLTYSTGAFDMAIDGQYQSSQFDDDLNTRRLGSIFLMGGQMKYRVSDSISIDVSATNLFDSKVVSAVTASGLETLAQRRRIMVGIALAF